MSHSNATSSACTLYVCRCVCADFYVNPGNGSHFVVYFELLTQICHSTPFHHQNRSCQFSAGLWRMECVAFRLFYATKRRKLKIHPIHLFLFTLAFWRLPIANCDFLLSFCCFFFFFYISLNPNKTKNKNRKLYIKIRSLSSSPPLSVPTIFPIDRWMAGMFSWYARCR